MKKALPILMACGGLLLAVGSANAEHIVKPHIFSAGTPANANQVNANFDTVYGQVNKIGAAITVDGANSVGIGVATPAARLDVVSQPVDYYSPWAATNLGAIPCLHCADTCNGSAAGAFTCPEGTSLQCEDLRNSAENGDEYRLVECDKILPAAGFSGDVKVSDGKLTAAALALPTGAANGAVLTSDGVGNATWQALSSVPQAVVATMVVDNGVTTASIAAGAISPDKLADVCVAGEVLIKTANGWVCGAVLSNICTSGDFISCYRSSVATMNVGACRAGIRPCQESGTGFGACQGEVLPAADVCDSVDNDCDGIVDNGPDATAWYQDNDGDGFGDTTGVVQHSCTQQPGMVSNNQDCNDQLSSVYQTTGMSQIRAVGGVEICGDGVDNDCDGQTDNEGCAPAACTAGEIAAFNGCMVQCGNFTNPFCVDSCLNGQLSWVCRDGVTATGSCLMMNGCLGGGGVDAQCARACRPQWEAAFGALPPLCTTGETRACGTNAGECSQGTESCVAGEWSGVCSGAVNPVAEICGDGLDNDCNGFTDEAREWYEDYDGDGFGDPNAFELSCEQPPGFVANIDDCDDLSAAVNPNAVEVCDGLDNNCDGQIDMNVPGGQTWWFDQDGDGYGGLDVSTTGCAQPPPGYAAVNSDCDDSYAWVNPGAPEQCGNSMDDDCDGQVDEGCDVDSDGDGYPDAMDCAPNNAAINPDAAEVCGDSTDNNCDGQVDEGCGADSDGDGYPDTLDCAPYNVAINPDAAEVCGDSTDNNCDGQVDEGCGADSDGDGYPDALDCAPSDQAVHPGALEICDGLDNDCDAQIDNIAELPQYHWLSDLDGDTHAATGPGYYACAPTPGFSGFTATAGSFTINYQGTLLNPDDGSPFTGAANLDFALYEQPNYQTAMIWLETHAVNVVDGAYQVELGQYSPIPRTALATAAAYLGISVNSAPYAQAGMPFGLFVNELNQGNGGDCDDTAANSHPGAPEICDGRDNNCDGQVDEGC